MRFNACLIGLVFASSAGAQDVIRYDFAIRVLSNTVPSGDLASIGVNEVGTFTLIALDDRTIFPQFTDYTNLSSTSGLGCLCQRRLIQFRRG